LVVGGGQVQDYFVRFDTRFWFAIAAACWFLFFAYWLYAAIRKRKAAKRRDSAIGRMGQLLPMAAAYILMFSDAAHWGWLGMRFLPRSVELEVVGAVLTAAGLGMAIWARRYLGANWSAQVSIRADHELIRTGPYRWIRHPIYTGMLIGLAGTELVLGENRGMISFAIAAASFYFKARKEEIFLAQEFGSRFQEHTRNTGMFLPRFS
jgi:protein-S-isoprenylcysteine O-methyltransferase Ste14